MGRMRFVAFPADRITPELVEQAYLCGLDRMAWQVHAEVADGQLVLERMVCDSACLNVPWPVEGRGPVTLATGSLLERPEPYQLPLELARGTLGQLRNQVHEWETLGLAVPEAITQRVREAVRHFARAAVTQHAPETSAPEAEIAIRLSLEAGDLLAAAYVEQALALRRRGDQKLTSILAGDLGSTLLDDGTARQFLATFNTAVVPACWREVEATEGSYYWATCDKQIQWSKTHRLMVCCGPLLKLDPRGIPDWLYLWEDDFDNILAFSGEFIQATVTRYRGQVDMWVCGGRLNAEILSLSEEDKLRLAARAIELTRSLDPETPVVLSFDQPWAEYMSHREVDFPPLHFADALVRAGLELGGLVLEVNLGYHPEGTLPRTPVEFSRQLDHWGLLGLPLFVSITVPSSDRADPLAQRQVTLSPGSWTPQRQQAWVARYVPLLLAKPAVVGVIWNQLCDSEPHDFPNGGLFDQQQQPKPALKTLSKIRLTLLK